MRVNNGLTPQELEAYEFLQIRKSMSLVAVNTPKKTLLFRQYILAKEQ